MKKTITIFLLMFSLSAFAENPLDQYCGKEQYGYLYRGDLYTLPFGQGWMFPRPPQGSEWVMTRQGYLGAAVYQLSCQLPLDDYVLGAIASFGVFGFFYIRSKQNLKVI
jgi:hypothetical protein